MAEVLRTTKVELRPSWEGLRTTAERLRPALEALRPTFKQLRSVVEQLRTDLARSWKPPAGRAYRTGPHALTRIALVFPPPSAFLRAPPSAASMIYSLSLETALLVLGVVLILAHGFALLQPDAVKGGLKAFPRSQFWGGLLLAAAAIWFWWLVSTMDLGEFSNWRGTLKIGTPIAAVLTWMYVQEFLAVRALGMLVLLGAEALLEAAWMRPEMSRLWMVSLVYLWVTAALFWVGMPYTFRNQMEWVSARRSRWVAAAAGGVACGVILLISRLTLHR